MVSQPVSNGARDEVALRRLRDGITELHTLGPAGTNCEQAARCWWEQNGGGGSIVLHATLEEAAARLRGIPGAALMACVVYPELHTLMFSHLHRLVLVDCLITPTFDMVLAVRPGTDRIRSIAHHPAPSTLVPAGIPSRRLVSSNSQAARDCAAALVDACITTRVAADSKGLRIVRDFGPILMGFTVHAQLDSAA